MFLGFSFDGIWMNPLTAVAFAIAVVSVLSGCALLCPCRDRFKVMSSNILIICKSLRNFFVI